MSGFVHANKRPFDNNANVSGGGKKKAKNLHCGSHQQQAMSNFIAHATNEHEVKKKDPIETFYTALVNARSVFSCLDVNVYQNKLPSLVKAVLDETSALSKAGVDLAQCLEAVASLRAFHVRERITKLTIPRYIYCNYVVVLSYLKCSRL